MIYLELLSMSRSCSYPLEWLSPHSCQYPCQMFKRHDGMLQLSLQLSIFVLIIAQMDNQPENKPDSKANFVSQDRKNLNSYYSFKMDQAKFDLIKTRSRIQIFRFAVTGVIFGFITEYMLGNSTIYSNIIKKATTRRLKAKRKEDLRLEEKAKAKANQLKAQTP